MLTPIIALITIAGTPTYSAGRIAFDSHSLIIDGKPTFIYSGAFHYFRCPKELWRDRFRAIKAAGMNAVETYIAWNWHERSKPSSPRDYTKMDLTDLKDWLKMAHDEFGLYTILRPGPYICAEWTTGGYPRWLTLFRPNSVPQGTWYRGDDPTYLAWCKHWYDAVCKITVPEQVTHKPAGKKGVILFQIENEYDYAGGSAERRRNQLKALYDTAREHGIDVPITGCWTHELRRGEVPGTVGVFDSPNLYSRHDIAGAGWEVDRVKREQQDAPGMVTELQGGWFSGVGGELSEDQGGIEAKQIRAITLECIARGASILNYYMFFGGTHFGDWGARGLTTSYDYYAPIREWGAVGDKYREVQAIARMLYKYGSDIAVSERVDKSVEDNKPSTHFIVRRGASGDHYVFMRNSSERESRSGIAKVNLTDGTQLRVSYELTPFGTDVVVVPAGETQSWNGRRICEPTAALERPEIPGPIRIARASVSSGNGSDHWVKRKGREPLATCLGPGTAQVFYRDVVHLKAEQLPKIETLAVDLYANDACMLRVNGTLVPSSGGGRHLRFPVKGLLKAGDNELLLLYEDAAQANGGQGMEDLSGVDRAYLAEAGEEYDVTNWRVKEMKADTVPAAADPALIDSSWDRLVLDAETVKKMEDGFNGLKWPAGAILNNKRGGALYRTRLDFDNEQLDRNLTTLVFDRIDDHGTIYVNGKLAGHHDRWDEPCEIDIMPFLHPGANVVAVYVVNSEGEGGLTRAVHLNRGTKSGVPVAFQEVSRAAGTLQAVSTTGSLRSAVVCDLDTGTPVERKGGEMPKGTPKDLVTWTVATFELPATQTGIWIPWRLLVRAAGNGEIYLNGHSIGRYWEVGPQREFFLPECWLQLGKGKRNVLAIGLHATKNQPNVAALEVSPYPDSAEFRH